MPPRLSRLYSTYAESAIRDAAIRSGASRSAWQTWHQVTMSASLAACLASSILVVFAGCHPAAADRSRPDSPASSRRSRSLSASRFRARWTLDDGDSGTLGEPVVRVRDGPLPDRLERPGAHRDHPGIGAQLVLNDPAVPVEVVELDGVVVEQPEVVPRQAQVRGSAPGQPADLLAGGDVQAAGRLVLEPDVVVNGLGDDPR